MLTGTMPDHLLLCVSGRSARRTDHPHVTDVRVKNLATCAVDVLALGEVADAIFAGERFFVALGPDARIAVTLRTCACGAGELYAAGPGGNLVDQLSECSES
jgi:hypothetical protein